MEKPAFEQVYENHKKEVWGLVSKYVPDQADREDLFQEVFLKIYKALAGFRAESTLKTWIFRITVNTSLNYLKRKKRQRKLLDILGGFRLIDVEEKNDEVVEVALQPLAKLNPKQKMILLLVEVEEKSLMEVSVLLRLPVGTVKSNLHRAKEIVKKELNENA